MIFFSIFISYICQCFPTFLCDGKEITNFEGMRSMNILGWLLSTFDFNIFNILHVTKGKFVEGKDYNKATAIQRFVKMVSSS